MITFFVPGDAVPQGRPRAFVRGGRVGMYDPAASRAWKKVVAQMAGYRRDRWHEGALSVELRFFMKKPKSLSIKTVHHVKKPDCDNLAKAVLDALNGVCWKDDSQIVDLRVVKRYTMMDDYVGVQITIQGVAE